MARTGLFACFAVAAVLVACGDSEPTGDGGASGTGSGSGTGSANVGPTGPTRPDPDAPTSPDQIMIEPAVEALGADSGRDMALLELMIRLNAVHFGMEPHIRDRERFEDLAAAADVIAGMCEEPAFVNYTSLDEFQRDPTRFDELHTLLRESSQKAATAARAGDVEGLFQAYTAMDASCTACHKRYAPLD
jgi:hypothetical protein